MVKEIVAKLKKSGKRFEILVDFDKYQDYKKGKIEDITEVVIGSGVFSDIQKANRVEDKDLISVFGTDDFSIVCKEIVDKGEVQLTTEERRKMVEDKKKKLINMFSRKVIDPRTGKPYPPLRIENAFKEAGVHIDAFKPVEIQFNDIVKVLKTKIPISMDNVKMRFRIPVKYQGSVRGFVASVAKIIKEDWYGEYWMVVLEFPKALSDEIINKINSKTHGESLSENID